VITLHILFTRENLLPNTPHSRRANPVDGVLHGPPAWSELF